MSKGNTIVPIRIPAELLAEVEAVIERSHTTRSGEPWTRTAFILAAVREKLAHMTRSNRNKNKRWRGKDGKYFGTLMEARDSYSTPGSEG